MKRFLKILTGVVVVLLVVIAAAVAYVLNIDPNAYKSDIKQAVKEATGRDLVIEGPIELDIGTETTFKVTGVKLSNAEWGTRDQMVTVDSLAAAVKLFSLIGGAPDVSYIRLNGVRAIVEKNEQGISNTQMQPPGEAKEEAEKAEAPVSGDGDLVIPVLREIQVSDVEVLIRDAQKGTENTFTLTTLTLTGEGPDAPMSLNLDAGFDDLPVTMEGSMGSPNSMLDSSNPWPVDIKGNLAGINVTMKGTVQQPAEGEGFDVTFNAFGEELAEAAKVTGIDVPSLGAFDVKATAKGDSDELTIDPLAIRIGKEDMISLTVDGKIESAMEQEGIDLAVTAKSTQIGNLTPLVEPYSDKPVPALGALDTKFRILGGLEDGIQVTGLDAKLGDADKIALVAKGGIANVMKQQGIDLNVTAKSKEIGNLQDVVAAYSDQKLANLGPLDFAVRAVGDAGEDGELGLQDLNLDFGRESTVKVTASGSVANALNGSGANVEFAVVSPDLSVLGPLAGGDVPPIGPVDVKGTVSGGQGEPLVLDPFTAKIGKSDLSGKVTADMAKEPIEVSAVLNSSYFSTEDIAPPAKGGSGGTGSGGGGSGDAGGSGGDGRLIPDDPLPLEGLKSVNADVTFTAKTMLAAVAELDDVTLKMKLKDGHLTVEPFNAKVGQGTIKTDLSLDARESDAKLKLSIAGDQMDVERLLAGAGLKDRATGPADMTVDLTGTGSTARAIAASLDGKITYSMYDSRIREKALRDMLGDLIVDRLTVENGWVVVDCAVFDYDVAKGVMDTTAGYTASGPASVKTSGTIDLGQEQFDLGLKAEGGSVISIPLIVVGPLADPTVAPDPKRALLTIGAGILTGGIGPALLTFVADLPDDHPCRREVEEDKKRAEQTDSSSPADDPKKAIEDAGKAIEEGIGGAVKGLFGD